MISTGTLAALAAALIVSLGCATEASASRSVEPAAVDLGTIKNGPAGGRLTTTVLYSISADETNRYAFNMAGGGAPNGSSQFSVAGGNCATAFPTLLGSPASCTIAIEFDYSRAARGPSFGTLLIDADANYLTSADQLSVPLSADLLGYKRRCKKRHHRSASAAKKKCKKKRT